ncbi:unnamed protein product [Porites evermanni]|uniref:SRCR domain-containing protein n=1 Tax=Porites evermanni TaxID=104178 RepID=A0ABN8RX32_9CNID|nr:unnamed protein product [Porites evermanni]
MDDINCTGSERSLTECSHNGWGIENCDHSEDAGVLCSNVRLVDGTDSILQGRVEVFYNGSWGTVCDDSWDLTDASVVCRELGYGRAVKASVSATFGQGNGTIWMGDVRCTGNEKSLTECHQSGWGKQNCEHSKDAGVVCAPLGKYLTKSNLCIAEFLFISDIRLVNGGYSISHAQGRVEVFYNGIWGTVCDDSWDLNDAKVVCRQLGFGRAIKAYISAAFGPGDGKIWMDDARCTGSERSLTECSHNGWGVEDCDHGEDAGVLRQRSLQGAWIWSSCKNIRVCDLWAREWNNMDDEDVGVVCASGKNNVLLSKIKVCHELAALDFSLMPRKRQYLTKSNLCIAEFLFISDIRLVNGGYSISHAQGRVEVFYNGIWGTVCDDSWDLNDAKVVCRQLGFGRAIKAYISAAFGPGDGKIWMDDARCTGSERSLTECSHNGWGVEDCDHGEDAGVLCSIRLVGWGNVTSQGRVEVFFKGTWGGVCGTNWDIKDATVVCRQLGFKGALAAITSTGFPSKKLIYDVHCVGNETSLTNCDHKESKSSQDCINRAACVMCISGSKKVHIPVRPITVTEIVLGVLLFVSLVGTGIVSWRLWHHLYGKKEKSLSRATAHEHL